MWILDSGYRDGIDLWYKDGTVTRVHHDYDPPFYLHLPDPHAHYEMIGALEDQCRAEACTFATIFGELDGYAVYAGREVAEAIERQTEFDAQLYNVDTRRDQRFMAENGIVPCSDDPAERFSPEVSHSLSQLEIRVRDDPARSPSCTDIEVVHERTERLAGEPREVLLDLFSLVTAVDPDVILMTDADAWMPRMHREARALGLEMPFSRTGRYRSMDARSYWSYGRMEHKESALIPEGRILIDTEQSFVYREGGLAGVFMASRLSGLSPNLASRFTPGTLVSSYEVYEALKRKITVPFRKSDGEKVRKFADLQAADRGGMMFQPSPGTFENVEEIDFTSMYPSIIVQANLSPETVEHPERPGFLPLALRPLLDLRIRIKDLKKTDPQVAGIDAVLKWMLVTCFGYTGYRNAKFGRIEVHEAITGRSREILLQTKDIAEDLGFSVLHGIVDCLWVQGAPVELLKARVEEATGLHLEVEHFDWIVFLPLADGFGAYNRYYGRLPDGSIRVRGIAARRHDTPAYVREMQRRMLDVMKRAETVGQLDEVREEVAGIFRETTGALADASPGEMAISRRISRLTYRHRCIEGAAVQAYKDHGIAIAPGMKIRYVVTDARRYCVEPAWCADSFDLPFYRTLLDRAYAEIAGAFHSGVNGKREPGWSYDDPVRKYGNKNTALL